MKYLILMALPFLLVSCGGGGENSIAPQANESTDTLGTYQVLARQAWQSTGINLTKDTRIFIDSTGQATMGLWDQVRAQLVTCGAEGCSAIDKNGNSVVGLDSNVSGPISARLRYWDGSNNQVTQFEPGISKSVSIGTRDSEGNPIVQEVSYMLPSNNVGTFCGDKKLIHELGVFTTASAGVLIRPVWFTDKNECAVAKYGTLLAKIVPPNAVFEDVKPLVIGKSFESSGGESLLVAESGTLYLRLNDGNAGLADNTGVISVVVKPSP